MDIQQFKGQMDRLAAAYRVDVPASTRAAYLLAFQKTSDEAFAAACELSISQEKMFPSIATMKEILKIRHETSQRRDGDPLALDDGAAGYSAVQARDRAEIEKWAAYREDHERRFTVVPESMDTTPPPMTFVDEVRERAAFVPVPLCITPFVIVSEKFMGRAGFVAKWANLPERSTRANACDWRDSRAGVRMTMAGLYADVQEVK